VVAFRVIVLQELANGPALGRFAEEDLQGLSDAPTGKQSGIGHRRRAVKRLKVLMKEPQAPSAVAIAGGLNTLTLQEPNHFSFGTTPKHSPYGLARMTILRYRVSAGSPPSVTSSTTCMVFPTAFGGTVNVVVSAVASDSGAS
jgi:hypothetical protein